MTKHSSFLTLVFAVLCGTALAAPLASDYRDDRKTIEAILAAHDKLQPGLDEYMDSVADDFILMPNGGALVEGKAAYRRHVQAFYESGSIHIRHEVIEVHSYPEVVIARGRAVGTFTPPGGGVANSFETHNLFIFHRAADGRLKVWQIIFNDAPRSP